MLIATAAAALVMLAGDAAVTEGVGGAAAAAASEAPKTGPTTVAGVTVNKPKRECRKVRVTGARNARLVCATAAGEPPAETLGVGGLSPTMLRGDQGNLNQAPRD